MDHRVEFISRLNAGEKMTDLCIEYGVSRKTGHKLKNRYEELGPSGLEDRPMGPRRIPHKTTPEVIKLILGERRRHPSWGPKKLKAVLEKRLGRELPAASTFGNILVREGLVEPHSRHRPRHRSQGTKLREAQAPNDLWCIDYKGQFRLGDGSYCYPLTVTDQRSRYILCCDAMAAINEEQARESMEAVFRQHGLPTAIRSDNGPPFASSGLWGLTKLSVYWLQLGIETERSRPAHPQDNGRHERMHRTLKRETTRPARRNLLQQQETFDAFVDEFNRERPHEALDMQAPATLYTSSLRPFPNEIPQYDYSAYDDVIRVSLGGNIRLTRRKSIRLTSALEKQYVGIREEQDGRWLVSFHHLNLGYIDKNDRFSSLLLHPQLGL
jgi:transposase InsO family protein